MEYSWDIKGCTPPAIKRGNWTVSRENYPTKWCIFRQTGSRRSSHALKWKWTQLIQLIIFFNLDHLRSKTPFPHFFSTPIYFQHRKKTGPSQSGGFYPTPFLGQGTIRNATNGAVIPWQLAAESVTTWGDKKWGCLKQENDGQKHMENRDFDFHGFTMIQPDSTRLNFK